MDQVLIQLSDRRWRVLQPAIYLVSVLPALLCWFVFKIQISVSHLMGMGLAVVFIQHAINVFNDETDWQKGADTEKTESWFHFHLGNLRALKAHAWTSFFLGIGLGMWVLWKTNRLEVLWVALPLVFLGFLYNHSHWALSYTQWGEWVTGICYGPGVFGCMAYVLTGQLSKELLLGSLACASLAVAVLLSHQPPQVLTDFAAGKHSFAVRHGVEKTYLAAKGLTAVCLILLASLFSFKAGSFWALGLFWLITQIAVVTLPKKLSPPIILRVISLQVLVLGIFTRLGGA